MLGLVGGVVACDPTGGGDAGLDAPVDDVAVDAVVNDLDAGLDATDAAEEVDALAQDGGEDAPDGLDCAPCGTPPECFAAFGCAPLCELAALPDGTPCGDPSDEPARSCAMGVCVSPAGGCGDGIRDAAPREGCDDGNTLDGDACSASCTPTLMVLSRRGEIEGFDVAGAEDASGAMLFAWVESEPGPTERVLSVRAAIFTGRGVRLGASLTLETNLGVGQAVTPVVAGLASGWVVAWRSTTVEGADADLGGIAYRTVRPDGTLGLLRQANPDERFDQRDPSIVANDTGFIVAWTDASDRPTDPGLGVRARLFGPGGAPLGAPITVAADTAGDQSQPSLSCARVSGGAGSDWAVAYTESTFDGPQVVLRRYVGATAVEPSEHPLSPGWASNPRLSAVSAPSGSVWAAWLGRTVDPMGQGHLLFVPGGATPSVSLSSDYGDLARRDDGVVVAGMSEVRAVVGWRTDATPQGLRIAPIGWTLPPEGPELIELLAGGRQRDLVLVATSVGLWLAWTDESIPSPGTPSPGSAVVAYLLPWD